MKNRDTLASPFPEASLSVSARERRRPSEGGMTLVEVLIGTMLLVGGGGALLVGMQQATSHADYLSQFQIAMQAAQGELDELASTDFDTLLTTDCAYSLAPASLPCANRGIRTVTLANRSAQEIAGALLTVQIKPAPGESPSAPSLLDIHVAACWRFHGRALGDNRNCNGQMEVGEDADGDGWFDSPAMVSTRVGRRL